MLRVLVDDIRRFTDGRECILCRDSDDAVITLEHLRDAATCVDELWLDYDLGGGRDVRPVLAALEKWSHEGQPLAVGRVLVHTSSSSGAALIKEACERLGYPARRIHDVNRLMTW